MSSLNVPVSILEQHSTTTLLVGILLPTIPLYHLFGGKVGNPARLGVSSPASFAGLTEICQPRPCLGVDGFSSAQLWPGSERMEKGLWLLDSGRNSLASLPSEIAAGFC